MTNSNMWSDMQPIDALLNAGPDTAVFSPVFSGGAATRKAVDQLRQKEKLINVIDMFYTQGFSWSYQYVSKLSWPTVVAGKKFLELLPLNRELPQVSPDGEGGLMMVWEKHNTLVTIDDLRVHIVTDATTPKAEYYDSISFDASASYMPQTILDKIPTR